MTGKARLRSLIKDVVPELPDAAVEELTETLHVKLANCLHDYDEFGRVIREELAKVWPH